MPTATSGGASNAWEESTAEPEAPAVFEGEHGPELELSPGAVGVPGGLEDDESGAHESRAAIVTDPVLPDGDAGQSGGAVSTDYASMTQAALRDEAKARGLPVAGAKADLAARLADHDAAQSDSSDAGTGGE